MQRGMRMLGVQTKEEPCQYQLLLRAEAVLLRLRQ
jgi:hypothetical protein